MCPDSQFPADLVTFTKEFLNGKLHFLCSDIYFAERRRTVIFLSSPLDCSILIIFKNPQNHLALHHSILKYEKYNSARKRVTHAMHTNAMATCLEYQRKLDRLI